MDVDDSVMTAGGRNIKGLNGNGKNTIKKLKRKKQYTKLHISY